MKKINEKNSIVRSYKLQWRK